MWLYFLLRIKCYLISRTHICSQDAFKQYTQDFNKEIAELSNDYTNFFDSLSQLFITPNHHLIYSFSDLQRYKYSNFKYFDTANSSVHRIFYSAITNVTTQEMIYSEMEDEYYLQPQGMYIITLIIINELELIISSTELLQL